MKQIFNILIISFITIVAYSQQHEITGIVFSSKDNARLAYTKLLLFSENKYIGKTKADINGKYWFSGLKKQIYTLQVHQENFIILEIQGINFHNSEIVHLYNNMVELPDNQSKSEDKIIRFFNCENPEKKINLKINKSIIDQANINLIQDIYDNNNMNISNIQIKITENYKATHFSRQLEDFEKRDKLPY